MFGSLIGSLNYVVVLIIVCAAALAVCLAVPVFRVRGDYLAIVTMAFAEIIRVCFCNFSITGGGKTMSGILKLSTFPRAFWVMVVCVAVMFLFVRSKYGRTIRAIREDYIAASASGINVTYYKVMTFAISAFFAGIGGALMAQIAVNVGMNLRVLPVIGVTLPFYSAGGSSVLMLYICVGLVLSVYMHNTKKLFG